MAGAAPRSTTSCVLSVISPAPVSSAWNATTGPPVTSWAAAAGLIAHNEGRLGKTLYPATDDMGEQVRVTSAWDSGEEARAIGDDIESRQRAGFALNDMAILVRASFQMREFEDRFVTLGLNYRVIGGPRFYERMEIRDALAYLRAAANPADDLAFERIVNTPKRGLGAATIQLIHAHARQRELPLMAAARELVEAEDLKPRQRGSLAALLKDFETLCRRRSTPWPTPISPKRSWRNPATRRCGWRTGPPRRPAVWRTSRNSSIT